MLWSRKPKFQKKLTSHKVDIASDDSASDCISGSYGYIRILISVYCDGLTKPREVNDLVSTSSMGGNCETGQSKCSGNQKFLHNLPIIPDFLTAETITQPRLSRG